MEKSNEKKPTLKPIPLRSTDYSVRMMLEDSQNFCEFSQGLFLGIDKNGGVILNLTAMTHSQLCFLKCNLDIFVERSLSGKV